jgi:predicted NAD/FAD-binding protein
MAGLFAQRRNLARPRFLKMLRDIMSFNSNAERVADERPDMTTEDLIAALGLGHDFRAHYLEPFSGAIWSTPVDQILAFPAQAMVRFFRNHALMSYEGAHQWYTVPGGSIEYVRRLDAAMRMQGVEIRLGCPVEAVRRMPEGVEIRPKGGSAEVFDEVVFATHSDVSLRLLADPSPEERANLGAVAYQPNEVVLHADPSLMPKRRKCWSSWNYTEPASGRGDRIGLTYWMNSLQPIPKDDPLFVTLNATDRIREEAIHDVTTLHHPVYDLAALAAQDRIAATNGTNATWFCGAWMKNGFHEDGLASAVDVVTGIGRRTAEGIAAQ